MNEQQQHVYALRLAESEVARCDAVLLALAHRAKIRDLQIQLLLAETKLDMMQEQPPPPTTIAAPTITKSAEVEPPSPVAISPLAKAASPPPPQKRFKSQVPQVTVAAAAAAAPIPVKRPSIPKFAKPRLSSTTTASSISSAQLFNFTTRKQAPKLLLPATKKNM